MINVLMFVVIVGFLPLLAYAQPKDAPQAPAVKGSRNPVSGNFTGGPQRKPGMAASVEKAANAPAVTTAPPNAGSCTTKFASVYQMQGAIKSMENFGYPPDLIAKAKETLASLQSKPCVDTPPPANSTVTLPGK